MSDSPVLVIAEAGVNHNGNTDEALALVDAATAAGADIVKFQSFTAAGLAGRDAPKAAYQQAAEPGRAQSQRDMLAALELDATAHRRLVGHCAARGIEFLSSPFDPQSLALLTDELNLQRLKFGSGELTNAPLLLQAGRSGRPVILSTGMADLEEVEAALGALAYGYLGGDEPGRAAFAAAFADPAGQDRLKDKVTLLHCTSQYPAPFAEINLRAMDSLAARFGLPVGFSDHSPGIAIALAAVGRGAGVIEKHFTRDRGQVGPDHKASLEPGELTEMIAGIRQVEAALGDGIKKPTASEADTRQVARKSLVAACPIAAGETFSDANLAVKRPAGGLDPFAYWDLLGRTAPRDFAADEMVET